MRSHRQRTDPRPPRSIPTCLALAALAALTMIAGCTGDSTKPGGQPASGIPQADFDGQVDPGGSSFVLTRVPGTQPGRTRVEVELIGEGLVTDPATETVTLNVSIRNVSRVALASPVQVWLSDFAPPEVEMLNADYEDSLGGGEGKPASATRFGFDYSDQVGPDDVLSPGESSAGRPWQFHVPGLAGFSFAAIVSFAAPPGGPVIAGLVFHDGNANGVRDPDEPPFSARITLRRPDGTMAATAARDDGAYSFPVQDVGLHTLRLEPGELGCPCELVATTPNPLQVLVIPGENGEPQSYLHADFGVRIVRLDDLEPVVLTDRPPGEIRQDPYRLEVLGLTEDVLALRVGFSGCTPLHEFTLFMSGGFMESNPVQARLVLGHNDLDEDCDAAFARTFRFDLTPVREAFERAYGQHGPIVLRLTDLQGNEHIFRYRWGPMDGQNLLPNGSFEREGQPSLEGWEVVNPALTSVVRSDAPGSGTWALRLNADWAPTTGLVRAPVAGVVSGQSFRLSAWVRAMGEHGGGMLYLETSSWTSEPVRTEADDWTRLELTASPPIEPGDTLWVVLSSLHTEVMHRNGLFDRVVLEALPGSMAQR